MIGGMIAGNDVSLLLVIGMLFLHFLGRALAQMISLRKSIWIGCLLVALVGVVTVDALSARALAQGAIFRPTSEDVDPGIDHGNSSRNLPETYQRQLVFYRSLEPPGTIIVETSERHLYLIQSETRALRYGIGVGREGFTWQGLLKISRKAEWPDWIPPPEMIARQPYLPRFMGGGPGNPLGARALYLGNTIYRIHGTNQPQTIGQSVSSGCFRLVNSDVIDLYDRIPVGTKVIVHQAPDT